MIEKEEFRFICSFAQMNDFGSETICDQLRSLWTAYCLHYGLEVDAARYDAMLWSAWCKLSAENTEAACWTSYDSFADYMAVLLV